MVRFVSVLVLSVLCFSYLADAQADAQEPVDDHEDVTTTMEAPIDEIDTGEEIRPEGLEATTEEPSEEEEITAQPKNEPVRLTTHNPMGKTALPANKMFLQMPVWKIAVAAVGAIAVIAVVVNLVLMLKFKKGAFQKIREKVSNKEYAPMVEKTVEQNAEEDVDTQTAEYTAPAND